ncbi:hypothetical protein AAVH_42350, partial [Aphelenchoides avenae]
MSFDELALRNPMQADTPEHEFVEDQHEHRENAPQHPQSDRPAETTGTIKKEGTTANEEEGTSSNEEEEETDIDEQEGTTDTEDEAEESEFDNVCEDAQEDAFGRDDSSISGDGIASDDGDSSAAQSSEASSSEESSGDDGEFALPHIQGLFREDLEDGESDYVQPASDNEHADADDEFTDDELVSGDDEVVVAGEARRKAIDLQEGLEKACRRCRKRDRTCSLRNSPDADAAKCSNRAEHFTTCYFRRSVKLYPHQVTGMELMEVREQCGNCRGGILADAPGCGKTVTVGGHLSRQKLKSVNVVPRLRFDNEASDSEIEVDEDPAPVPLFVLS